LQRVDLMSENVLRVTRGDEPVVLKSQHDELGKLEEALFKAIRALQVERLETKTLIYSASHDLRSPLVNLQGFSNELELSLRELEHTLKGCELGQPAHTRIDGIILHDIPDTLKFIRAAIERLEGIIDSLMLLPRLELRKTKPKQLDLAHLMTRIIDTNRSLLDAHATEIVLSPLLQLVTDGPQLVADGVFLEHIFGNLISNAAKYLRPDVPGRLEIGMDSSTLDSSGITLFVRDNGRGIPRLLHSRIFVAFQRLHPDVTSGEGVGLTLVKRSVERLGGRIWFESTEDRGSTFYVYLPFAQGTRVKAEPQPSDWQSAQAGGL
jgi:signal transduction histidine kinase